jgi:hypothetical protein
LFKLQEIWYILVYFFDQVYFYYFEEIHMKFKYKKKPLNDLKKKEEEHQQEN